MSRFEYRVHPAQAVVECFTPPRFDMADAYLSSDAETDSIKETLAAGFRWVRTDGEHAIFERATPVE